MSKKEEWEKNRELERNVRYIFFEYEDNNHDNDNDNDNEEEDDS